MSMPPYQFGISEFTTMPWSFAQDVQTYADLGIDTIEVCEVKLDAQRISAQLAEVAAHGLRISSAQPKVRTLFPSQSQPEPRDPNERMALFRHTIEGFGEAARGVPFITNTGIAPKGNIAQVLETAIASYQELADAVAHQGARIALEPLNPSIMNVESAIWTIEQAMQIVNAVDRPNLGLCIDAWNIWQNANLTDAIRACGDRIFVVQLSDWRTPRSVQDRLSVRRGAIPLPPLLRAIHNTGYRGAYSVEIFSSGVPDALWAGDLNALIRENKANFAAAWQAAFAEQ